MSNKNPNKKDPVQPFGAGRILLQRGHPEPTPLQRLERAEESFAKIHADVLTVLKQDDITPEAARKIISISKESSRFVAELRELSFKYTLRDGW